MDRKQIIFRFSQNVTTYMPIHVCGNGTSTTGRLDVAFTNPLGPRTPKRRKTKVSMFRYVLIDCFDVFSRKTLPNLNGTVSTGKRQQCSSYSWSLLL